MPGLVPGTHAAERCDVSRVIWKGKHPAGAALAGVDARNKSVQDAGAASRSAEGRICLNGGVDGLILAPGANRAMPLTGGERTSEIKLHYHVQ
jgi:hypothetical protein